MTPGGDMIEGQCGTGKGRARTRRETTLSRLQDNSKNRCARERMNYRDERGLDGEAQCSCWQMDRCPYLSERGVRRGTALCSLLRQPLTFDFHRCLSLFFRLLFSSR